MCPECNIFYCLNCINKLKNLENASRVCETPFDETKHIQLLDNEKGEKEIETFKIQKLKKNK